MSDSSHSNNSEDVSKPRRAFIRRPQFNLDSSFGPVLDLSAGGMRVVATRPLSGMHEVRISGMGFDQRLKTKVVWVKKLGFRVYEIGFEFLSPGSTKHLLDWISQWTGKTSPK